MLWKKKTISFFACIPMTLFHYYYVCSTLERGICDGPIFIYRVPLVIVWELPFIITSILLT